jgi:hypothetical protein
MPTYITIAAVTLTTICASIRYICWQNIAYRAVIVPCIIAIVTQAAIFAGMDQTTCGIPATIGTGTIMLTGFGALHDIMNYRADHNVPNAGYAVTVLALACVSSYSGLRTTECNVGYGVWTATLGLMALPISTWTTELGTPAKTNECAVYRPSLRGF